MEEFKIMKVFLKYLVKDTGRVLAMTFPPLFFVFCGIYINELYSLIFYTVAIGLFFGIAISEYRSREFKDFKRNFK